MDFIPSLTNSQKVDLANALQVAWKRYVNLLGEAPHGTKAQVSALVELMNLDDFVKGIVNRAHALHAGPPQTTTCGECGTEAKIVIGPIGAGWRCECGKTKVYEAEALHVGVKK